MVTYVPSGGGALTPAEQLALQRQMERDSYNNSVSPTPALAAITEPALDPYAMADAEYASQFAALEAAAKAQQDRYTVANKDIASMYEALAASTLNRQGGIREQYDATGDRIGSAYQDAIKSLMDNNASSSSSMEEMLRRLGIEQAAPAVLAKSNDTLIKQLADLNNRSSNAKVANQRLGQSEINYIGRTADTNRLAGKNAQLDLKKQLLALQAQNDQDKAKLISSRANAANQYALSIAKNKQDAEAAQASDAYKQAQLALDTAKFQHTVNQDNASLSFKEQSAGIKDPSSALANNAYSLYNGDASAAATASMAVINAYKESGGVSLAAILSALDGAPTTNALDRDNYKRLAVDFWARLSGSN